jgi:hypothetical protein
MSDDTQPNKPSSIIKESKNDTTQGEIQDYTISIEENYIAEGYITSLSTTAIIAFGFGFVFMGQWAFSEEPWRYWDLPVVLPLLLSLGLLSLTLIFLYPIDSHKVSIIKYQKSKRFFKSGIALLFFSLIFAFISSFDPYSKFHGSVNDVKKLRVDVSTIEDVETLFGPLIKQKFLMVYMFNTVRTNQHSLVNRQLKALICHSQVTGN